MNRFFNSHAFNCAFAVLLLFVWLNGAWARETGTVPRLVVMAAVSDNPRKLVGSMQPMARYVAGKLAPLGVESIEVLVADSHEQLVRLLRDGRVDWITETAYSSALLEQKAGAEILLRKWKHGVSAYHSVIFAHKDSDVGSLGDLPGRSIAFQHPGSTTGYFVPLMALRDAGLRADPMTTIRDQPRPDGVGYLFSGAEYNTAMWVHKRLVTAGVLSDLDWEREDFLPPAIRRDLRVIYTSPAVPRALELVRSDLHPEVKRALRRVLLHAHLDPEGRQALVSYQNTSRFDELDEEGRLAMQEIRANIAPPRIASPEQP